MSTADFDSERHADAQEDLQAIKEDWGAVWNDFDQIRMDTAFEF